MDPNENTAQEKPEVIVRTYDLSETDLPKFKQAIARLNRRATRLGIDPIEFEVGKAELKPLTRSFISGAHFAPPPKGAKSETVAGPAMRLHDGRVIPGVSHEEITASLPPSEAGLAMRGYVSSEGRYLTITQARALETAHQVIAKANDAAEDPNKVVAMVEVFPVTVSSRPVKLPGDWQFIARLEHEENGNLIALVPGEVLPEVFRNTECLCEHCRTDRKRKHTFVVRNNKDQRHVQVGSSCMEDFLGNESPALIAEKLAFNSDIWEVLSTAAQNSQTNAIGGANTRHLDLKDVLSLAACSIRQDGYHGSKDPVEFRRYGTRRAVEDTLWRRNITNPIDEHTLLAPTDEDVKKAESVMQWVREDLQNRTGLNDYQHNLVLTFSADMIGQRHLSYAISAIPVYNKEMDLIKKAAEAKPSEHVGEVGKRDIFDLSLVRSFSNEGIYGLTSFYVFKDQAGNSVVWNASGEPLLMPNGHSSLDLDTRILLKGTVKEHGTYTPKHGPAGPSKQTRLSNCKLEAYVMPVVHESQGPAPAEETPAGGPPLVRTVYRYARYPDAKLVTMTPDAPPFEAGRQDTLMLAPVFGRDIKVDMGPGKEAQWALLVQPYAAPAKKKKRKPKQEQAAAEPAESQPAPEMTVS